MTALEKQLQEKLGGLSDKGFKYAALKAPQQSLEASRKLLASRQREAELAAAAATMRRWPHLRSSIVRVPTGAEVTTAVMIELDDALPGSKLSDGGGSPR